MCYAEQAINNVLMLKNFLHAIPALFESLAPARCDLLTRIRGLCRPEITNSVVELICGTINEDAIYAKKPLDLQNQRTHAVKVRFGPGQTQALLTTQLEGRCEWVPRRGSEDQQGGHDLHQHIQELNCKRVKSLNLSVNTLTDAKAELGLAADLRYDNARKYCSVTRCLNLRMDESHPY